MKIITNLLTLLLTTVLLITPLLAADYYVDATSGKDSNDGKSSSAPWRTISKVNESSFNPGDSIHFKCSAVWREQLYISSSGSPENYIKYTKYGAGDNPKILQTEVFNSWELIDSINQIYRGKIEGQERYYGMLNATGDGRSEGYLDKVPFSQWKDTYFHGYYGSDGYFLYRNNAGYPGQREIGVRSYGIIIRDADYIIVDGIDVYGPSGSPSSDHGNPKTPINIFGGSNIIVKNCNVKYSNGAGIKAENFSGLLIENCLIEDCWGGIRSLYAPYTADHLTISNCVIRNIATKNQDTGDRSVIGLGRISFITIENCKLDYQGRSGTEGVMDYAIQFAAECSNGIVRWCHIKGAAKGSISVGNPKESKWEIYGNIIDDWGDRPSITYPNKSLNGIAVGMGSGIYRPGDVYIYNNLFINGPDSQSASGKDAALYLENREYRSIFVANNIFYNNNGIFDIYWSGNTNQKELINNCFFRFGGNSINYYGKIYDYAHVVGDFTGTFQQDKSFVDGNMNEDPLFKDVSAGNYTLSSLSPCIDNGVAVNMTTDKSGNTVPVGEGFDIGPFEYQGDNLTSTPTGLKIMKIN